LGLRNSAEFLLAWQRLLNMAGHNQPLSGGFLSKAAKTPVAMAALPRDDAAKPDKGPTRD
tara:strand:- start:2403 stop:2582 length:180 start_codon:yes stop_codon:yes gene_type:complete